MSQKGLLVGLGPYSGVLMARNTPKVLERGVSGKVLGSGETYAPCGGVAEWRNVIITFRHMGGPANL